MAGPGRILIVRSDATMRSGFPTYCATRPTRSAVLLLAIRISPAVSLASSASHDHMRAAFKPALSKPVSVKHAVVTATTEVSPAVAIDFAGRKRHTSPRDTLCQPL